MLKSECWRAEIVEEKGRLQVLVVLAVDVVCCCCTLLLVDSVVAAELACEVLGCRS